MSPLAPYILMDDQTTHELRFYTQPIDIVTCNDVDAIEAALETLKAYHAAGYYLAGYLSYDLGFAFEPKLNHLMPAQREAPLLQFGVFESISSHPPAELLYSAQPAELELKAELTESDYTDRFNRVMDYIKAGDVYQINLTFPMTGTYDGTASQLYAAYRNRQKGRFGGIVSLGSGPEIISLSPELFFRKKGCNMSMRPMKGTRPRADTAKEDHKLREDMRADVKSRAENLMIVDLLRNDLSRISETGSVKVPELFALETYPTLHQMTSRVTSQLKAETDFADIFKSLFPCGSVTGAPKIRAMEIIDELEHTPRGAYCGGLGFIDPNGDACFNVSIRTMILNDDGKLRYNVGSGLVLDSDATDEYQECLLKADVLKPQPQQLIETFHSGASPQRVEAHKQRLENAAKALNFVFDQEQFTSALLPLKNFQTPQRVRLTLDENGTFALTHSDYIPIEKVNVSISRYPLVPSVQKTSYKINYRHFYDGERERLKALTGADEVIFLNANNELCEGSFTSLFIDKNGQLFTPPLSAGLLPGILREELLEAGQALEKTLRIEDLLTADKIYLGNSLRELIPAKLISFQPC